ncbi:uncharacterized protein LOC121410802 [Lytechinus variegatus]|uniref:uncharacterized protein LOC121410802 n=1 Tax=Lytechinus variegatus TaxID=7654 RepID=UPI001BB14638|nr:uncharacterized protein LOC121410802 [Lytechinus variegatus]
MSRPRNRALTARCRSRNSTSKADIIASQKQYLRQWNDVGLKPVKGNTEYALKQTIVDHEKAINTIKEVKDKAVETLKLFFKPLEDAISDKNRKNRKSLKEKKQKIENYQNRLKSFIQQIDEGKYSSDFDKNKFVERAEQLKLDAGQLAINESVICVSGVEINMVQTEVDRFQQQIQQFLKQFNLYDMFGVEDTKQEFKARITTPPELSSSPEQSMPTISTTNLELTPHPPIHAARARSACSINRRSQVASSTTTLKSIETVEDSRSRRSDRSPLHRSLPSDATNAVNGGKVKPTISVSPQQVVANDHQKTGRRLDHPYSVDVLSNGNKVVVETDALNIIDRDSNEIVKNITLYNRDEAKATGCCDLTVLKNDSIIVCDSQRKKLLLVRPDSDEYEVFMEFKRGTVPRAIANDGEILYICLFMESGDGVLQKIDIGTKRKVGHLSFPRPPMTVSSPKYVAINSFQEILVSDALNGTMWFVDRESNVHNFTNACIPGLARPTGMCWLSPTRFVVAVQDVHHHRLLVVDIADINHIRVINTFGRRGNQPNEFNSPEGMITYQGYGHDQLLVCDLMNSRLNHIPLSYLEDSSIV